MASTGHGRRSIPLLPIAPPTAATQLPPASAQSTGYYSTSQITQPVIPRKPVGSGATIRTAGTGQAFQAGTSQSNTGRAVGGAGALHGSHNVGGLQGNTSGSNASSAAVTSQTRTSRVLGSRFWPVGNAIVTITLAVFVAALTYVAYQWGKWTIGKGWWDYCISSRAYGYIAPDCETVLREGLSLPPLVKWKDDGPSSTLAAPTKALEARKIAPESTWDRRSKLHALVGYAIALVVGVLILVLILLRRPFRHRTSSDQAPRPKAWVDVAMARNIGTFQQICSTNLGWASLTYPTTCVLSKDFTRLGSPNKVEFDDVDVPYQQNENHELSRSKSVEALSSFGDNDDELAGAVAASTTDTSSEDSLPSHTDSTELWEDDIESQFTTDAPQKDDESADVNIESLPNTDAPHKSSEIADVDIDPGSGFGEQNPEDPIRPHDQQPSLSSQASSHWMFIHLSQEEGDHSPRGCLFDAGAGVAALISESALRGVDHERRRYRGAKIKVLGKKRVQPIGEVDLSFSLDESLETREATFLVLRKKDCVGFDTLLSTNWLKRNGYSFEDRESFEDKEVPGKWFIGQRFTGKRFTGK